MKINEEKGNLFDLDNNVYAYAHCISLDCEMGKGIAVEFNKRYDGMKYFLKNYINTYDYNYPMVLPCFWNKELLVFNLITKEKYWNKPTYGSIQICIKKMKDYCKRHNVKYLAMPRIGCGLDRLEWDKVKQIIIDEFKDLDIEIEIRYL